MKKIKSDSENSTKKYSYAEEAEKTLRAFINSDDNRSRTNAFRGMGFKYIELQKKYCYAFEELMGRTESNVVYKKYSKGGECIHRGVLSPSNLDMVVGGCNRGVIFKRFPKGKFSYEYYFDKNNLPICSKRYELNLQGENTCYEIEFLIYEKNTILGVKFSAFDKEIISINECIFESNRLVKYEYAFLYNRLKKGPELSIEIPRYENGRIVSLEWQHFYPPLSLDISEYNFSMDSEGLLSTYKVKQLYGYKPDFDYGDNPPENWVYHVFKSCRKRTHFDLSQGWI